MLYPSLANLLDQVDSRYLLVNIIARRARDISVIASDRDETVDYKPVSRAISEIAEGELRITVYDDEQQSVIDNQHSALSEHESEFDESEPEFDN